MGEAKKQRGHPVGTELAQEVAPRGGGDRASGPAGGSDSSLPAGDAVKARNQARLLVGWMLAQCLRDGLAASSSPGGGDRVGHERNRARSRGDGLTMGWTEGAVPSFQGPGIMSKAIESRPPGPGYPDRRHQPHISRPPSARRPCQGRRCAGARACESANP